MQFKQLAFFTSLVTLAVATPAPNSADESCSTGSLQCCSSFQSSSDPVISTLLGLLGIVLGGLDVDVGVTCSPITVSLKLAFWPILTIIIFYSKTLQVVGVSGTNCASQTVCCDNVVESKHHSGSWASHCLMAFIDGLIAVGCNPINIGLWARVEWIPAEGLYVLKIDLISWRILF